MGGMWGIEVRTSPHSHARVFAFRQRRQCHTPPVDIAKLPCEGRTSCE